MSLRPPLPGSPEFQDWKDMADAVDNAGILGAGCADADPHKVQREAFYGSMNEFFLPDGSARPEPSEDYKQGWMDGASEAAHLLTPETPAERALDFIEQRRAKVYPEYEGGWHVDLYDEQDSPVACYFHAELRHALQAAMAGEQSEKAVL